jgi:hypothetical protein
LTCGLQVRRHGSVVFIPKQLIQGRKSRKVREFPLCVVGRLKPRSGAADIGIAVFVDNSAGSCRSHAYGV